MKAVRKGKQSLSARQRMAPKGPRLGEIALASGFVTAPQLDEAVQAQQVAAKGGLSLVLGEVLLQKNMVTPSQLDVLIDRQNAAKKNFKDTNQPAPARHSGVAPAVKSENNALPVEAAPEAPSQIDANGGVQRSRTFGDYYLFAELGRGAMGIVYVAQQISTKRDVAIKILYPDKSSDPEFRTRHLREANAVMRLNHPNIVAGIDAGCTDGLFYFAMEFVDGKSLSEVMADGGGDVPEKAALDIVRQIALGLHHAHSEEILHRDIKPENILIGFDGTAKLCDLGLVRDASRNDGALTQVGETVGSAYYISPEQARNERALTPSSDLYSLGATLFQALTGQPPYNSASTATVLLDHATAPVPDPRALQPRISEHTARIVMKLLQKNPLGRYASGAALAKDLERAIAGQPPSFMRRAAGETTTKMKTLSNKKEGLFKRVWNSIVGGNRRTKKTEVRRRDSSATFKAVKHHGKRDRKN